MNGISEENLLHKTITEAIMNIGGFRAIAIILYPKMSENDAYYYLKNCLYVDTPEELSLLELITIGKISNANGHHRLNAYLNNLCGYEPAKPRTIKNIVEVSGYLN